MIFAVLLLSLLGLFSSVLAAPASATSSSSLDPKLPYPEVPLTFIGNWGGHDVSLTGTAQEMIAQMQALHPDFEFTEPPRDAPVSDNPANVLAASGKECFFTQLPPLPPSRSGYLCCTLSPITGQWFDACNISKTLDNIWSLQHIPLCYVNPLSCVRIACQYSAGIFFCNDNDYQIHPSCGYLASYAQDLVAYCGSGIRVCGQEFDSDRYNVIVSGASC